MGCAVRGCGWVVLVGAAGVGTSGWSGPGSPKISNSEIWAASQPVLPVTEISTSCTWVPAGSGIVTVFWALGSKV